MLKLFAQFTPRDRAKGENEANIKLICFFNGMAVVRMRACARDCLACETVQENRQCSHPCTLDTLNVHGNMKLHISRVRLIQKSDLDLIYDRN